METPILAQRFIDTPYNAEQFTRTSLCAISELTHVIIKANLSPISAQNLRVLNDGRIAILGFRRKAEGPKHALLQLLPLLSDLQKKTMRLEAARLGCPLET